MRLGGKNPIIIFGDCILEEAVNQSVLSSLPNQGKFVCVRQEFLVEENIYDQFLTKFVEAVKFKVGDPKILPLVWVLW